MHSLQSDKITHRCLSYSSFPWAVTSIAVFFCIKKNKSSKIKFFLLKIYNFNIYHHHYIQSKFWRNTSGDISVYFNDCPFFLFSFASQGNSFLCLIHLLYELYFTNAQERNTKKGAEKQRSVLKERIEMRITLIYRVQ